MLGGLHEAARVRPHTAAASWPELHGSIDVGRLRRGSSQTKAGPPAFAAWYRVLSCGCPAFQTPRRHRRPAAREIFSAADLLHASHLVPVSLRGGEFLLCARSREDLRTVS